MSQAIAANTPFPSEPLRVDAPRTVSEVLEPADRDRLRARIRELVRLRDAVVVAHYYTDPECQLIAEDTGGHVADSLEMARFGHEHPASTLVVCGVRFMGETAKILNPEKRVLMPDLAAECSLDLGCPPAAFAAFCDANPDRTVVVYANTSAAVKARADWMVTSSIAVDVVRHLADHGHKILFAPDRYLGVWVQEQTGADMLLWNGSCVVHEEFKGLELEYLRRQHPGAMVLVHPEAPPQVIEQADVVGSTTQLIAAAVRLPAQSFIVATDRGIFHKMQAAAPGKTFLEAPTAGVGATCKSCAHCPWMAMNSLTRLAHALEHGSGEIDVEPSLRDRARIPIERMLAFAREQRAAAPGHS